MTITTTGGAILLRNGQIGTQQECCCPCEEDGICCQGTTCVSGTGDNCKSKCQQGGGRYITGYTCRDFIRCRFCPDTPGETQVRICETCPEGCTEVPCSGNCFPHQSLNVEIISPRAESTLAGEYVLNLVPWVGCQPSYRWTYDDSVQDDLECTDRFGFTFTRDSRSGVRIGAGINPVFGVGTINAEGRLDPYDLDVCCFRDAEGGCNEGITSGVPQFDQDLPADWFCEAVKGWDTGFLRFPTGALFGPNYIDVRIWVE
jgi:hypothetical protein